MRRVVENRRWAIDQRLVRGIPITLCLPKESRDRRFETPPGPTIPTEPKDRHGIASPCHLCAHKKGDGLSRCNRDMVSIGLNLDSRSESNLPGSCPNQVVLSGNRVRHELPPSLLEFHHVTR